MEEGGSTRLKRGKRREKKYHFFAPNPYKKYIRGKIQNETFRRKKKKRRFEVENHTGLVGTMYTIYKNSQSK